MKKLGLSAFVLAFGFSAGLFLWDYVAMPELGRILNKREKWNV